MDSHIHVDYEYEKYQQMKKITIFSHLSSIFKIFGRAIFKAIKLKRKFGDEFWDFAMKVKRYKATYELCLVTILAVEPPISKEKMRQETIYIFVTNNSIDI